MTETKKTDRKSESKVCYDVDLSRVKRTNTAKHFDSTDAMIWVELFSFAIFDT